MAPVETISVLVPVFNNAETLPELARQVSTAAAAIPAEVQFVFVEDASTDRSAEVLRHIAAGVANVHLVLNGENIGQQAEIFPDPFYSLSEYVLSSRPISWP